MSEQQKILDEITQSEYKFGFSTDIEMDVAPVGLNEDIIRFISEKKGEPDFILEWRLKAFRHWQKLKEPTWGNFTFKPIDYQALSYYAAPKKRPELKSMDEVDPELKKTFEKLGISLAEQKRLSGVAVDEVQRIITIGKSEAVRLRAAEFVITNFAVPNTTASAPDGDVFGKRMNMAMILEGLGVGHGR